MTLLGILHLALLAGTPLILAVIGETVLQRAGILNIGLEGMLLAAAMSAVATAVVTGSPLIGVIGGIAGAAIVAIVFGFMTITSRADQIISGAALNFAAAGMTSVVYSRNTALFVENVPAMSSSALDEIVMVISWTFAPLLAGVLLFRTRTGLRLRAAGESPAALTMSGLSSARYRWIALAIEAVVVGVAGAYLALGLAAGFAENMTSGRGFIALAIVILGRWRPLGIVLGVSLFSLTIALQYHLQASVGGIQFHLLLGLPYVVTLLVLAFSSTAADAPGALGK